MAANTNTTAHGRIPAAARATTKVYAEDHIFSRFHNLSPEALADEIGRVDAAVKGAEAELKALKEEFKARGLTDVAGDAFVVSAADQVAWRLDTKKVRDYLGEACSRFETVGTTTVIRVRAASRFAVAA